MFLKPKHFIFECRPNFGSFYPLPGLLRAITFSAPNPPPLQISAYATDPIYITIYMHQWRAVTSESGHAICMPKSDHENRYVMGVRL